ncbi:MAG: peptidase family protein, partial [Ilumatobacteraceae bacterium]|nr:peptidase family protein [Ilumatobacteraceae bacterium]
VRPAGAVQQPRPTADGRMLCVRDDSGWNNLWLGDEPLVDEPFEHGGPTWGLGQRSFAVNDDGTAIAFTRNEHGFGRLCVVDIATRQVSEVARGVHGQLSWSGSRLAAVRTGARTPTQIVVYDTKTWMRDVVEVGPNDSWSATELVEPELIDVPTREGEIIHARLYRHDAVDDTLSGAVSERLMCFVHGGPTDQWQVTFMPRIAFWRSQGYDVLVVDHRGSTGHGRAYQQAMNGRWGELDVADVVDAVRHAHQNGWGAPARTVLVGGSAGGFTVLGALAEDPRLAAAGVVSYPVTDLFDLAERSHRFEQHYTHHLVGPVPLAPPADGPYLDRSPVSFAARITTPLLMFHGELDPVVPVEQSRRMATHIAEANGIVALVTYPGEGHGFRQRDHQLDEYRRTLSFLADHFVEDGSVRLAPVSEWNASDPEAAKVFYDLTSWDFDQQAELASALADAEIPHSWEGIELVIPPEAEDATDTIFAELEERLQIASADDTDAGERDGEGGEVVPRELADDTPITDYDLTEWADLERSLVIESLGVANIPFRFDVGVLSVPTSDEGRVDDILDEIESGDIIPVIQDGPDGDVVPFESLNSFFLAGERLRKDARDADGLERLLEALEIADPNRPPRGVELRVWRRTCELAESLADALADDAEPEDVQAIAEALHDLLRPLI